jgi:hypothetical protein
MKSHCETSDMAEISADVDGGGMLIEDREVYDGQGFPAADDPMEQGQGLDLAPQAHSNLTSSSYPSALYGGTDAHRVAQMIFNESALRYYSPVQPRAQLPPTGPSGRLRRTSGWRPSEFFAANEEEEAELLGHLRLSSDDLLPPNGMDVGQQQQLHDIEDVRDEVALAKARSSDVLLARKAGPEGILAQQRLRLAAKEAARRRSSNSGSDIPAAPPLTTPHILESDQGEGC